MDTLGEGYSPYGLRAVISGEKAHRPRKKLFRLHRENWSNMLVDIQTKLQAGKGAGYERRAKVFNLKQMAQAVNYLTEHKLLEYDALAEKRRRLQAEYAELLAEKVGMFVLPQGAG